MKKGGKQNNYIKKREKGLKNASFWAIISKKIRGGGVFPAREKKKGGK